jgi:hypothetical protein
MKSLRVALVGLLIATTSVFAVSAKAADTSVVLSCVTFNWPDTIYRPLSGGNVTFGMSFQNNCTYDVLQAKYMLVDKFGTEVTSDGVVGLKRGVSANQSQTWSDFYLVRGTEPFTLKFFVENYSSLGVSNPAPVSIPFKFTERTTTVPVPAPTVTVTAKPIPAPTVTVTAQPVQAITDWAQMETLKAELAITKNDLRAANAKLKKICAARPKPKGC